MATVTGKTVEKLDEEFGETIVGANLDTQGSLTFTRKNGQTINAGSLGTGVVGMHIDEAKHMIFNLRNGQTIDAGSIEVTTPLESWPVGSIYIGVTTANPSTLLGGGTWEAFAKGKMLVGVDPADTSFDAVEETGGAKTKTIAAANLPPHSHTIAHVHDVSHSHASRSSPGPAPSAGGTTTAFTRADGDNIISGGGMIASYDGNTGAASTPNSGNGPGTSSALNVMNPYITVYMWKRTA